MSNKKTGQEPTFPCEIGFENGEMVEMHQNGNTTALHNGMSKREYAAIHLKVPDSGEEWLDEMIRKANLRDAAHAAMQGLFLNKEFLDDCRTIGNYSNKKTFDVAVGNAYDIASFFIKKQD